MRKITTLSFFVLLSLSLSAQSLLPIRYGIKAGANIANINSISNDGVENIDCSSLIGILGGFYMEIPLNSKLYLNPDLIYTQKGAGFTYSYMHDYEVNERDLHTTSHELKLAYVEINPTMSYKASSKLSLNFGPSISYLITRDYKILTDIGENDGEPLHEVLPAGEYKEESFDIGLNLGLSYYLHEDFLIDGKINTGFLSAGKISKVTHTGSNQNNQRSNIYNIKNNGIVFSIAYLF